MPEAFSTPNLVALPITSQDVAGIISLASISVNLAFTCIRMNELSSLCISLPVRSVFKL